MPFVKLDCKLLHSTLWLDVDATRIFITALLMAEPWVCDEPVAELDVNTMKPTGWEVPSGWYGFVPAAGPGIVSAALLDMKVGMDALVRLGTPEPESRSPEFDGRRLVRVRGGFVVLNYMHYREQDLTGAERQRRWRQRNKPKGVTRHSNGVTRHVTSHVTQAEVEVEVEAEGGLRPPSRASMRATPLPPVPGKEEKSSSFPSTPPLKKIPRQSSHDPPAAPPKGPPGGDKKNFLLEGLNKTAFAEWDCERRRRGGKSASTWTPKAQEKCGELMALYTPAQQQKMVDTAIAAGWAGLVPPKANGRDEANMRRIRANFVRRHGSRAPIEGEVVQNE
jgi:hypothetical protein